MPHVRSYPTILFNNLLPLLKNEIEVRLTWFVPIIENKSSTNSQESDSSILFISNYKNAVEVIEQVKPDMIYSHSGYSPVDYAFAVASKHLKIPVIAGEFAEDLYEKSGKMVNLNLFLRQFYEKSTSSTKNENQRQFMVRGVRFTKKYLFFLRTLNALKISKMKILESILFDIKRYCMLGSLTTDNRFSADINFVESEKTAERLVKQGFEKSSIFIVGNPTYDEIFQKFDNFESHIKKDNRIRVLLVTKNPNDPGGHWKKKLQDSWLKELAAEFSKYKNEMSLVIKIHPSGENLSDYESVVKPIEPSISIFQQGDIVRFLEEADVVIGTSTSTALVCSLIAKKPIIIWNVYGVKGDVFLERNLALECKNRSSIIPLIRQILTTNPASTPKVEEFVHDYLYKVDGGAVARISNVILNQIKNLQ